MLYMFIFYVDLIVFLFFILRLKVLCCEVSSSHLNNISSFFVKLGLLKMEACSVKRVAGTCT
jgi:hypothetical protein